jgi:predicted Rossmann-fold nucleotide-binding protein
VASSWWRRNELLYLLSDSFVAFPGGLSVVTDLIQVASRGGSAWPSKPTLLMNVDGYFDPMLECLNRARDEELAGPCEAFLRTVGDVEELFDVLRSR